MKKGILNIAVSPWHKTSLLEAGVYNLKLEDGMKYVALGHAFYPDHDRSLFNGIVYPALQQIKPDVVFALGGMIHDDAFQYFAPRDEKRVTVHQHAMAPEIAAVLKQYGEQEIDPREEMSNDDDYDSDKVFLFKDRVAAFGKDHCGQFIASLAHPANSTVLYIPSASPLLPHESEIMTFLYYSARSIDTYLKKMRDWIDKHPDEAPNPRPKILDEGMKSLPTRTEDYARLLGLDNHPLVKVLRFSSGVLVNDTDLFMVGDFRRRNPVTGGVTEFEQLHKNPWRSFDGKAADGWFTTLQQSMPCVRKYHQYHEIPNLFDEQRMGYLRRYDRWSQGFACGTVVRGQLHGCVFSVLPGADGRRGVTINGVPYFEENAGGRGWRQDIAVPRKSRKT